MSPRTGPSSSAYSAKARCAQRSTRKDVRSCVKQACPECGGSSIATPGRADGRVARGDAGAGRFLASASDEIAAAATGAACANCGQACALRREEENDAADSDGLTVGECCCRHGISRRGFIQYCTAVASAMALPPWMGPAMAEQLAPRARPSVIYLSFQECTGCLESLTRSFAPTIEDLIFNMISLDYNDTLMAAAGEAAESARAKAMKDNFGKYVLVVDGSVPTGAGGAYCAAGGRSAVDTLREAAQGGRGHRLRRNLRSVRRHSLRRSEPDLAPGRSRPSWGTSRSSMSRAARPFRK